MDSSGPKVSVVIVSWNTKKLVLECLASLEPRRERLGMEIILVDNASSDGTQDEVRREFPKVRLVQNEKNVGFSSANNIGIGLCSGQYICLINSDVLVPQDCLEKMLDYMERHQDIGIMGPKMILPDGTIGQSCMRFPSVWNWFCRALALDSLFKGSRVFGDFLMTNFKYDKTADVEVLTGWFWMIRAEALNQVGLLDDRFFMYGEDIDWPKRFRKGGWRVVFYAEAAAIHQCAASSSKAPIRFYVEMNRANLQYFRKHHNQLALVGFWAAIWLHQVIRIAGYGAIYLVKRSRRTDISLKLRRSVACLLWLMGLVTPSEVG